MKQSDNNLTNCCKKSRSFWPIQQNQLGTFPECSRHYEIIVFHKIVWQSNNLQRYRSFDVTIPLWEDNQAADTFSQSSKWNRRPVSVGANDVIKIWGVVKRSRKSQYVINILGVVKRFRKSQYVISLSFVIRSSWIVIRSSWIVIRSSWIVVWSQWIAIWSPWIAIRSSCKCKQGGRGGGPRPPFAPSLLHEYWLTFGLRGV